MKQLLEFIPIILFFIAYKLYDIYVATGVVIVATIVQVAITWLKYRKVEKMQWITLVLIVVMGGATIYLQDENFIKWKLTIIEWLFGLAFLGSQFIGHKPFVERMMGANLELPGKVWRRLNLIWSAFFMGVGCLNLYVMYSFNTDDWVSFKTFVVPGLMVVFIILQMIYLYRYLPETEEKE
ncbi:septation protein A [Methylomarinum sp. Ch1-1]|uniref:Inner membrane-spanning protein YciB n=1 Tax=Methylomarinum roseum TaxID=3067653 RepID=A0AAU7NQV3_9GAMM|nr:septation protein A [Methylomarinum sp. Ch1-1]MDP4520715.1 septation protein A [Methylomarinum sp. Ch1-1]